VVTLLHDEAKVDYVAPGHCTGEPAFAALMQAFGDHYLYAGLGTVIALGPQPHPLVSRGSSDRALAGEERSSYFGSKYCPRTSEHPPVCRSPG